MSFSNDPALTPPRELLLWGTHSLRLLRNLPHIARVARNIGTALNHSKVVFGAKEYLERVSTCHDPVPEHPGEWSYNKIQKSYSRHFESYYNSWPIGRCRKEKGEAATSERSRND